MELDRTKTFSYPKGNKRAIVWVYADRSYIFQAQLVSRAVTVFQTYTTRLIFAFGRTNFVLLLAFQ